MTEKKLNVTCADAHGIDEDLISMAIYIENFMLESGATPLEYTRAQLLTLAVEMKKVELLRDIEESLSVIRESINKRVV